MKALLVKQPWIDKILRGEKRWELRGSRTKVRGPIALIQSGTSVVVGTCELVDVEGPLSLAELRRSTTRHRVRAGHFNNRHRIREHTPGFCVGLDDFTRLFDTSTHPERPSGSTLTLRWSRQSTG